MLYIKYYLKSVINENIITIMSVILISTFAFQSEMGRSLYIPAFYDYQLENWNKSGNSVTDDLRLNFFTKINSSSLDKIMNDYENRSENLLINSNLYLKDLIISLGIMIETKTNDSEPASSITLIGLSSNRFKNLEKFYSIQSNNPQNYTDIIVSISPISSSFFEYPRINESRKISINPIYSKYKDFTENNSISVTISGLIYQEHGISLVNQDLLNITGISETFYAIQPIDKFINLVAQLSNFSTEELSLKFTLLMSPKNLIDPFNPEIALTMIENDLRNLKYDIINEFSPQSIGIESTGLTMFLNYYRDNMKDLNTTQGYIFLILFILSLFLINFSSDIGKHKRLRLLNLMKERGIDRKKLLFILIVNMLFIILIGCIGGYIISLILSFHFTQVLLNIDPNVNTCFDDSVIKQFFNINHLLTSVVFPIILIIFIFNGRRLYKESKENSDLNSYIFDERQPYWKQKNLDLWFLGIGSLFLFFLLSFQGNTAGFSVLLFFFQFSIIAITLGVVGFILFLSRSIPFILNFSVDPSKRFIHSLIPLALRNCLYRKKRISQGIILFSFTFSCLIIVLDFPHFENNYINDSIHYELGSSIAIENIQYYNSSFRKMLIDNYSSIIDISPISLLTFREPISNGKTYKILGIDPSNFESVAFFKDSYLNDHDLSYYMERFSTSNYSIIIDSNAIQANKMIVGQKWSIIYSSISGLKTLEYEIIGSMNFWPRLITRTDKLWLDSSKHITAVLPLSTLENLSQTVLGENYKLTYTLLVKSKNTTETMMSLRNSSIFHGIDYTTRLSEIKSTPKYELGTFLGRISAILGLLMTISILPMISFSRLIELNKIFIIQQILGFQKWKQTLLMFIEQLIVTSFGILLGIFNGSILSFLFQYIYVNSNNELYAPITDVNLPINGIINAILITLIGSLIILFLTSIILNKRNRGMILEVE